MATKAELEEELAALRQELDKHRKSATSDTNTTGTQPAESTGEDTHGLKKVLADHGVDAESIESLSETLLEEFKSLQKEKPLTVALAAFALGLVVGRASK